MASIAKMIFAFLATAVLSLMSIVGAPAAGVDSLPDTVDAATVVALQGRDDVMLIDVREPEEYRAGHIPGITLIPMKEVPNRLAEIPKDKTVILSCRSGNRSGQVAQFLHQQGYHSVHNLKGGILAWQAAGYPVER